jgi:hypothetical protein
VTPRPKETLQELPSGLVVVRHEMTQAQKKQRRADNKLAKEIRQRKRKKKHGRQ